MAVDKIVDPIVRVSDYGISFVTATEPNPTLHTPPLFLPPEDLFHEHITLAADIWTLGASLYEVLGERPLFESLAGDRDDIFADTISTLGIPPKRWWDSWKDRHAFFESDDSWRSYTQRIYTPGFVTLRDRLWGMGRGSTPQTCEWDIEGGEMQVLENLLSFMLNYEPAERPTAEQLLAPEYMVKREMPAWERKLQRTGKC